jgi:hypothetical protein
VAEPAFYLFSGRPVTVFEGATGGIECLALDSTNGNFLREPALLSRSLTGAVTREEFSRAIGMWRCQIVKAWCEQMCRIKTGATNELEAIVGNEREAPVGAERIEIEGDRIGIASIAIRFPRPSAPGPITQRSAIVTRADVDGSFGVATEEPRIVPVFPPSYSYLVRVPGAPHACKVFATTQLAGFEPESIVSSMTLRLERGAGA